MNRQKDKYDYTYDVVINTIDVLDLIHEQRMKVVDTDFQCFKILDELYKKVLELAKAKKDSEDFFDINQKQELFKQLRSISENIQSSISTMQNLNQ